MGKVLLGNIRGPQGETGGPYNTLSSFYGTLDPTGAAASDLAIANWIEDCGSNGNPGFAPPGTYKITSQMNWQIPGLQIVGSGSQVTKFRQATSNTGVVAVAGQAQDISGLDFGYSSQEAAANTASIGMSIGDDTVGSSFMSKFTDLVFSQCQRGMAINPAITVKAGLFSGHFDTIRVLGYSYSAIHLIGNAGGGAANCTGCVFDNVYVHNNFSGSDANSTWWPVYLQDWDEVTFNQLNIEHAHVFNSDAIGLVSVGAAAIKGLHLEHLELSGTPGFGLVYVSHASSVLIDGLSVRFPTMTGTSYNSVVRLNGTEGPHCDIRGLNEAADGGYATVHPLVDFNSATNGRVRVKPISKSQATEGAINAGSGCLLEYEGGWDSYPAMAHPPTGFLAETYPRQFATAGGGPASGTLAVRLISLRAGQLVSNIGFYTNANVKTGGVHGWYVLMDLNRKVLAVTADKTDASTTWGVASTKYPIAVVAPYTVPNDGDYYIGVMVANTSGTQPNFAVSANPASIMNGDTPILAGTSSTGQTTPPSLGTTMGTITSAQADNLYGFVS